MARHLGGRGPQAADALCAPDGRLLDGQRRCDLNRLADVVEVGRRRQNHVVDLAELLVRAVAFDHHGAAQLAIAGSDVGIEPKKAAQVDIAFGGDLQFLQCDALQCAKRCVADDHAGVEGSEQVFLRIGKAVPPPSSSGSSMSIAKRRDTSTPPIANPSTCARECVPPCQALATRQCVMPLAGSESTLSISSCTASVSMPLTTLEEVAELACAVAIVGIVSLLSCNEDRSIQAANACIGLRPLSAS